MVIQIVRTRTVKKKKNQNIKNISMHTLTQTSKNKSSKEPRLLRCTQQAESWTGTL